MTETLIKSSVKIKKLPHAMDLPLPYYATQQSAGMDLVAAIDDSLVLKAGAIMVVQTGIALQLQPGFEMQLRPRSGIAVKHGVTVLNSPGTIDADYRGEIKVVLINHGKEDFVIKRGERIAQAVIARYEHILLEEVDELDDTDRGIAGFGSTGK